MSMRERDRERELAGLSLSIAMDRGVPLPQAVEQLAAMRLPSFIDAPIFRTTLVEATEMLLRAELEEQLQQIRQRVLSAADPANTPRSAPPQPPAGGATGEPGPQRESTMVWGTQHGRPPDAPR